MEIHNSAVHPSAELKKDTNNPLLIANPHASKAGSVGAPCVVRRYILASESCALLMAGARYVRDVQPGEIVRIDETGLTSTLIRTGATGIPRSPAFCIFEYIYFARPDSLLEGQLVQKVRHRLGVELAKESPAPSADVVFGVPESSLPAAQGFSKQTGIPLTEGLSRNRYVHRTFIQPTKQMRSSGVSLKFTPIIENIQGKRVVLVDDSIVRGTTTTALVRLLRNAGAVEVHLRISSPPIRSPCYMGIDMATTDQLISYGRTEEEVCKLVGADSLRFLSKEGLERAVTSGLSDAKTTIEVEGTCQKKSPSPVEEKSKGVGRGYCGACFTGEYPLKVVDDW
jgi:amidophosphoribosyltransferase